MDSLESDGSVSAHTVIIRSTAVLDDIPTPNHRTDLALLIQQVRTLLPTDKNYLYLLGACIEQSLLHRAKIIICCYITSRWTQYGLMIDRNMYDSSVYKSILSADAVELLIWLQDEMKVNVIIDWQRLMDVILPTMSNPRAGYPRCFRWLIQQQQQHGGLQHIVLYPNENFTNMVLCSRQIELVRRYHQQFNHTTMHLLAVCIRDISQDSAYMYTLLQEDYLTVDHDCACEAIRCDVEYRSIQLINQKTGMYVSCSLQFLKCVIEKDRIDVLCYMRQINAVAYDITPNLFVACTTFRIWDMYVAEGRITADDIQKMISTLSLSKLFPLRPNDFHLYLAKLGALSPYFADIQSRRGSLLEQLLARWTLLHGIKLLTANVLATLYRHSRRELEPALAVELNDIVKIPVCRQPGNLLLYACVHGDLHSVKKDVARIKERQRMNYKSTGVTSR